MDKKAEAAPLATEADADDASDSFLRTLRLTLAFKIAVTVALWQIPALTFPVSLMHWLGFPPPSPQIWLRLLGIAYTALLVSYWRGHEDVRRRATFPEDVVHMGLVSNGGALVATVAYSAQGLPGWGPLARFYMWASAVALFGVTASLAWHLWHHHHDRRGGRSPSRAS